jgi:ABC-type glycerol-3-phosphate transport system permease component
MSLTLTLALIVVAVALTVFAAWRGSRPWDPRRGVRMIPWPFVMLLAAAMVPILVIHLAALLGMPQRTF